MWGMWNWSGPKIRVGLLGGTFDPIHLGHLLIAELAREELGLEEVVFIPTGKPWMKEDSPLSSPHHRLNMTRLGVASNPFFRASSLEIDCPGPTYTVDTVEGLYRNGEGKDYLYFVLGIDSFSGFHSWREPARVLDLATLVAVPRPGYEELDLGPLSDIYPSAAEKVVMLEGLRLDISGAEIRRRVSLGLTVQYQVPDDVERYVYRYGLYRDGSTGK